MGSRRVPEQACPRTPHVETETQTASIIPAAPIPVPIHIVTIPYFCFRRRNPCTSVAVRTAPVAPADAPTQSHRPAGLIFEGSAGHTEGRARSGLPRAGSTWSTTPPRRSAPSSLVSGGWCRAAASSSSSGRSSPSPRCGPSTTPRPWARPASGPRGCRRGSGRRWSCVPARRRPRRCSWSAPSSGSESAPTSAVGVGRPAQAAAWARAERSSGSKELGHEVVGLGVAGVLLDAALWPTRPRRRSRRRRRCASRAPR